MAVRFDASGERLSRTANLPNVTSGPFTFCGRARVVSDQGAAVWQTLLELFHSTNFDFPVEFVWNNGATPEFGISSFENGTSTETGAVFSSRPATGTDFFWAIVCSGSGANQLVGYWSAYDSDTFETATTSLASPANQTVNTVTIHGYTAGEYLDSRGEGIGYWDRALTIEELRIQKWSRFPVNPNSINFFWPLEDASDTRDLSGNARSPTVSGTLSTEAGPGVGDVLGPNWGYWKAADDITLNADYGSISIAGQAATARLSMAAAQGAVSATGIAATMRLGLTAAQGTVATTGQASTIAFLTAAAQGSVTVAGQAATFRLALNAAYGSLAVTGYAATFDGLGNIVMDADAGQVVVTGQSASMRLAMAAAQGGLSVSGQAAAFLTGMYADLGTIRLVGYAADLVGGDVAPPAPEEPANAGGRIVAGTFSRRRWRELQDARRALREAEEEASRLKARRRKAMLEAARKAQAAIDAAESAPDLALSHELDRLAAALDAARDATKLADVLKETRRTVLRAEAILRAVEEEREAEAVATMLLT